MLKTALCIAALGGLLLLNGCPGDPVPDYTPEFEERELSVAGPYTHKGPGTVFPEQFGGFTRVRLIRYDADEENISAGYNLNSFREPIILTLYVYPGPQQTEAEKKFFTFDTTCSNHFTQTLLAILASHKQSRLIEEDSFLLKQPGGDLTGKRAAVRFHEPLAGREVDCTSLLYLFYDDGWFYKYRVTCPTWAYDLAEESIDSFIRQFILRPARQTG